MVWISLTFLLLGFATSEEPYVTGYAYSKKGETLLFVEEHFVKQTDGGVKTTILVKGPDDTPWSEKVCIAKDNPFQPTSTSTDLLNNITETIAVQDNSVVMTYKEKKEKRSSVDLPENLVVDTGFARYIQDNFESLSQGELHKLYFAIPSRSTTFRFKLEKAGEGTLAGHDTVTFTLKPDNALIRMFVEPLVLTYDKSAKVMLRYEGTSGVKDARGKRINAVIVYPRNGSDPKRYLD